MDAKISTKQSARLSAEGRKKTASKKKKGKRKKGKEKKNISIQTHVIGTVSRNGGGEGE